MIGPLRPVAGVELTGDAARAVARSWRGSVIGMAEVPFDPARPADAVTALRAQLGEVSSISLAVGYAHLHVKAVRLPPVSQAQAVAILALEPDRFFPVSAATAIALAAPELACAADAASLERWVAAFDTWARVAAVHAAPAAAARALADGATEHAAIEIPGELEEGETALVEMDRGRLAGARRVPAGVIVATAPMPVLLGVPPRFAVAAGAALGAAAPLHDQLLSPPLRMAFGRDRARRTARATAALAMAMIFAVWALDHARARTLERTVLTIAQLADSAAPALALAGRLSALAREAQTSRASLAGPPDPLQVLAALSERLPREATVLALAADGDLWHLDGRTSNAAAIVPALDADPRLADVQLAGPTTRFTEGSRAYESFSVSFRAAEAR